MMQRETHQKASQEAGLVFFTELETADLLKISCRTLQRWRQEGLGLPFRRFGGLVRYARSNIDAWAAKQSRLSTSEVV